MKENHVKPIRAILGSAAFLAACLLIYCLLPYEWVKGIVDPFASDGEVELFTTALFHRTKLLAFGFTSMLLIGIPLLWRLRCKLPDVLHSWKHHLHTGWRQYRQDWQEIGARLLEAFREKDVILVLSLILLVGIVLRVLFLFSPIRYDEAYTFTVFAVRPTSFILSDYHVPNNHILHTLLVRMAYLLFGSGLAAVRLPAFLAGVCLIPAAYLLGRMLFNKYAGWLGAGLVVVSSLLVEFSTNARGYMLVTLFFVILMGAAFYLKDHKNLGAWSLLVLAGILGMYTIPIFLYPLGMVYAWLFLTWIVGDIGKVYSRKIFLGWLVLSGLIMVGIVLLLYTPVLATSGLEAVVGNKYVSAVAESQFIGNIPARIKATWTDWNRALPTLVGWLLAAGFVTAAVFSRRMGGHLIPFPLAAGLWLVLVLSIQRVTPWPRIWVFFLPAYLAYAAGGLAWLGLRARQGFRIDIKTSWEKGLAVIGIVGLLYLGWLAFDQSPMVSLLELREGEMAGEQEAAKFLKTVVQEGDTVVAIRPINYSLRYYLFDEGIGPEYLYQKAVKNKFRKAYVVVSREAGQNVGQVLEAVRLDEVVEAGEGEEVYKKDGLTIFEVER
jgi:hypothetical protein